MGSYVFIWPYHAKDVHVTGSFDDWGKSVQMDKVGEHWEKKVHFPSATDKVLYKFIVDDKWIVDENAPKEGDGHWNTNNVLLPEDITPDEPVSDDTAVAGGTENETKAPRGHRVLSASGAPPGTLSRNTTTHAPIFSAPTETAPTLTLEQSEANFARWIPQVEPPANYQVTRPLEKTDSNVPGAFPETPANEPESFGVAPIPATGAKDVQSTVTTSKEDYENAGAGVTGAEPEQTVSVNPIPATGHDNIQDTVTTSKEDYEKGGSLAALGAAGAGAAVVGGVVAASAMSKPSEENKNIIPESSLPMDAPKMDSTDTGPFVNSSGPGTTTADLASKVPLEPKREAFVEDSSATNPIINSSGPGTTTAALASQVPLEQKRQGMIVDPADAPTTDPEVVKEKSAVEKELLGKVPVSEATGEPESAATKQTSYHGLATTVPETVEDSMAKANAAPEAASSEAVVAEKSEVERELLAEVPRNDQAGEPAPTIAAATSTTAPAATTETTHDLTTKEVVGGAAVGGAAVAGATAAAVHHKEVETPADSSLANEPAVKMMTQNEGAVLPSTGTVTVDPADAAGAKGATASAGATTTIPKTDGAAASEAPAAPATPSKAAAKAPETPKKTPAGTSSAASTPAKSTTSAASSPGADGEKKKKKQNRLSRIIHKIFD